MALGNLGVLITSHLFATDCVAIFFLYYITYIMLHLTLPKLFPDNKTTAVAQFCFKCSAYFLTRWLHDFDIPLQSDLLV